MPVLYAEAEETVSMALVQEGIEAEVELVAVNTDEEAAALPRQPDDPGGEPRPVPQRGSGAGKLAARRPPLSTILHRNGVHMVP